MRRCAVPGLAAIALLLAACSGGGSSPEARAEEFLRDIDSGDATGACDVMLKEDYDTEYCLSVLEESIATWPSSDPEQWSSHSEETDAGVTVEVDTSGRTIEVELVQRDGAWLVDTWRDPA